MIGSSLLLLGLLSDPGVSEAARPSSSEQPVAARDFEDYSTYADVGLRWVRAPSVRDLARHHRVSTREFPYRGMAEVACTPDAWGRLDCEVIGEEPAGRGFAKAAYWVMRPVRVAAVDGYSPEGRTFAFRLRFGNWPASLLSDTFHPVDQNLRWVTRPELRGWSLSGLGSQQEARATFDCTARADGSLDCRSMNDGNPLPGFVRAAATSLEHARVERTDSEPVEGSPLKWTFRLLNQTNCGSGGTGYGEPDNGVGATGAIPEGAMSQPGADPISPLSSIGGSADSGRGGGTCLGAMVQMH